MFIITDSGHRIIYEPSAENSALLSAVLYEQMNDAGQLVFTMPITNDYYDDIEEGYTEVFLYDNDTIVWRGFVESSSVNFRQDKKVTCIGELSYLTRSILGQRYNSTSLKNTLTRIITNHNSQSDYKFNVGEIEVDDNTSKVTYFDYDNSLNCIREKLCNANKWNCYIKLTYDEQGERFVNLYSLENYGGNANQFVEFGKNLLDYNRNSSVTELYSQCYPRGARLDEQKVNNLDAYVDLEGFTQDGKPYVEDEDLIEKVGRKMALVTWDDVTSKSVLYIRAKNWLKNQIIDNIQLEVKAVDVSAVEDVQAFKLGDKVRVICKPYNIDVLLPIMSKETNLLDVSQNIVTVGNGVQLSYTQMNNAPTVTTLKQNDAFGGSISVANDITMRGHTDAHNLIRFLSNNHNCNIYGGNEASSYAIGCFDTNNGVAIWRYQDTTQTLQLMGHNVGDVITETGTKDGWEYIKFANGLYICSKRVSLTFAVQTAQGSIYYGDTPQITYPITFKSAPNVNANGCGTSTTNAWYSVINDTTTGCKLRAWRGGSSGSATYGVAVTVTGRWD